MKRRTGFSKIVVKGFQFQYAISFPKDIADGILIVYNDLDVKHIVFLEDYAYVVEMLEPSWRGKHHHQCWGKKQVAEIIMQEYML